MLKSVRSDPTIENGNGTGDNAAIIIASRFAGFDSNSGWLWRQSRSSQRCHPSASEPDTAGVSLLWRDFPQGKGRGYDEVLHGGQ